jgi:hypothetical protein
MAIDSTDLTALETKINDAVTTNPVELFKDAAGNEVRRKTPSLKEQADLYDWMARTSAKTARTKTFEQFKFGSKT